MFLVTEYTNNYQRQRLISNSSTAILFSRFGFKLGKEKFSLGANAMFPIKI